MPNKNRPFQWHLTEKISKSASRRTQLALNRAPNRLNWMEPWKKETPTLSTPLTAIKTDNITGWYTSFFQIFESKAQKTEKNVFFMPLFINSRPDVITGTKETKCQLKHPLKKLLNSFIMQKSKAFVNKTPVLFIECTHLAKSVRT